MLTKTTLLTTATLIASFGAGSFADAGILDVNLGKSGLPTEAGFTDWTTADNNAPGATTINGIGLSVTDIVARDNNEDFRSINRSDTYNGALDNLTQSWWGTQATVSGPGGSFTFVIDGSDLGAGSFIWTSWHYDHDNQSGPMSIEYSVDGGSNFSTAAASFDIKSGDVEGSGTAPNPATFNFTSDGSNDIHVKFTNIVSPNDSNNNYALINGFSVDVPEPSSLALIGMGSLCVLRRRRG